MSLFAVMRDYPWLKGYWYLALGALLLFGIALVLLDGYTQVSRGKKMAARKQQRLRQSQTAEEGRTASAVHAGAASADVSDADGSSRLRRSRRAE
jgi:hypothetical protein